MFCHALPSNSTEKKNPQFPPPANTLEAAPPQILLKRKPQHPFGAVSVSRDSVQLLPSKWSATARDGRPVAEKAAALDPSACIHALTTWFVAGPSVQATEALPPWSVIE